MWENILPLMLKLLICGVSNPVINPVELFLAYCEEERHDFDVGAENSNIFPHWDNISPGLDHPLLRVLDGKRNMGQSVQAGWVRNSGRIRLVGTILSPPLEHNIVWPIF